MSKTAGAQPKSRPYLLIGLVLAGFLLSVLFILPASLIKSRLPPNVSVGILSGSIWKGSTDSVAINGFALGAARWDVHLLRLLRGQIALDVELTSAQSSAKGFVGIGLSGAVEARDLKVRWPLSAIPPAIAQTRWSGELQADIRELKIGSDKVVHAIEGTVEGHNLIEPPPDGSAIGSYRLIFDKNSKQDGRWVGRLQDIEGPMQVAGTVALGPQREYVVEGMVATRPDAPPALTNALRYLGNPDSQGRRPFSIAGTY